MQYKTKKTEEYDSWYSDQRAKEQAQIEKRVKNIVDHGHFGDNKDLEGGLAELRFKNGRRIYFAIFEDEGGETVVLLLGGNKNGQDKDITEARKILGSFS